ncbi:Dynamin-like GTPase that mediates homotypic ER fusion [Conoideocrella luteorostrata]|uniref:Dynamin-like GTPase that mediates homotypic ER fusion n=1 Tax=Conoideocrella luteorostrata TaxID=1105319 RepID=A0AAJ0FT48_9HYPO|nr:Dynamin-like GTPase that mediates homotypic ER fusion [Conoideocrella luteorostrata]
MSNKVKAGQKTGGSYEFAEIVASEKRKLILVPLEDRQGEAAKFGKILMLPDLGGVSSEARLSTSPVACGWQRCERGITRVKGSVNLVTTQPVDTFALLLRLPSLGPI